jgi:hypothetical protein
MSRLNQGSRPMRVMVLVRGTEESEQGIPPTPEAMEAMLKYQEAVAQAGIVLVEGAG